MKEFIEKLIGRLEKFQEISKVKGIYGEYRAYSNAIQIVNQLAEEYKDKYVRRETLNQYMWERDTAISQLKDLGYGFGEKVGWISCSERLPKLTEGTECFKQSPCCLTTLEWWDGDMTESIGWYNQSGVWNEDSKNCKVIAWMPLPPAYVPKEGRE